MKLRVLRDFGFDLAGKHFNHFHEFDTADVMPVLPKGASEEQAKAHAAAVTQANEAIADGKKKGYVEEIDAKPAAKPAEKEG